VYDGIQARKWHRDQIQTGDDPRRQYFEVLELSAAKKLYVTELRSRSCTIYNTDGTFYRHDIDPRANFTGYEYIGSSPAALELSQWETRNFPFRDTIAHRYQTFTTSQCVPVRDDKYAQAFGFMYEEFSNVVLGIGDPNIFIPNPNCKPAAN